MYLRLAIVVALPIAIFAVTSRAHAGIEGAGEGEGSVVLVEGANDGEFAIEGSAEGLLEGAGEGGGEGIVEGEGEGEGEEGEPVNPLVVFVNKNRLGTGTGNGESWATAYRTLQPALDAAQTGGGGEVWVATGRYDELRTGGPLRLRGGVALYGGFAGTEVQRSARNWRENLCVIDGFASNNGLPANPVVVGADDARVDGFTITGGRGESGGGMINNGVSPHIENCIFFNNRVTAFGGGMYNISPAAPVIINSIFYNNRADTHGGAMANDSASPILVGCTISANTAGFRGAGLYNNVAAMPSATNTIIWNNTPEEIGATNISKLTANYCLSSTDLPGTGNVNGNPLFFNASTGNFALRPGSPAIDRGRDTGGAAFQNVIRDYENDPRGFDGDALGLSTGDSSDYDIGADEFTGESGIVFHSADTSEDFAISLSELLRVIQFYNSGGYQCVFGTEDGYAPGLGDCDDGVPHDSDYAPQNLVISLSELLRIIQFFNSDGGYTPDPDGEDGFAPVFLAG